MPRYRRYKRSYHKTDAATMAYDVQRWNAIAKNRLNIARYNYANRIANAQYAIAKGAELKDPAKIAEAITSSSNFRPPYRVDGGGLYTGHGGYSKLARRAMRLAGNAALTAGEQGLAAYSGSGAYEGIEQNPLIDMSNADTIPSFSSKSDETGALTITHKEYLGDVYGPADSKFNNQTYQLNPGLAAVFPWLSQIACNYEEYSFNQLMFTYRSTTTDFNSTSSGQVGTAIMACNYNVQSEPFKDKRSMLEYDASVSGKVTDKIIYGIECDPDKLAGDQVKFIRSAPVPADEDPKTYDHGLFQHAMVGIPSVYYNQTLGELWVSYTVTLTKPKLYASLGNAIQQDIYFSTLDTNYHTPLGTSTTVSTFNKAQQNNLNCKLDLSVSDYIQITFPANTTGYFSVELTMEGSGFTTVSINQAAWVYAGASFTGNIRTVKDIYSSPADTTENPSDYISLVHGSSAYCQVHIYVSTATMGINNSFKLYNQNMNGGTVSSATLKISQYNGFEDDSNDKTTWVSGTGNTAVF